VTRRDLLRFDTGDHGTLGRLGKWRILERPWRDNRPFISCVPARLYVCKRVFFEKGGYETFELQDVPDRSEIKFHSAAIFTDLEGCLGVGRGFAPFLINGHPWVGITYGHEAIRGFLAEMDGIDTFELDIQWVGESPETPLAPPQKAA